MNRSHRSTRLAAATCVALLCAVLLPGTALAEKGAPGGAAEEAGTAPGAELDPETPPDIDLERLLHLPESYDVSGVRHGGATAGQWRDRFREARAEIDQAQRELRRTQRELENLADAGGDYQVSAPGSSDSSNSPMHFGLRQDLRRYRELVELEERQLRELTIQADLANVPEEWRGPPEIEE
ncbi:MAG: hypothetical protein O7G30_17060 [Proteobacteria bacterium]|nr:hypothetical protein [Pseudomonadota bacterium]